MHIRLLCLASFLTFATCASVIDTQKEFGDLDSDDNLDEDEFEKRFGLEKQDPLEESRRREALKENEEIIKRQNEDFFEGKNTWWDEIDEFDNLPADEFENERTGAKKPRYARGLIDYRGPETYDNASERYFDKFRFSRSFVPNSYSSVDLGNVSPVKNQGRCGSCVAFANMALIETCFKKLTGVFGDYSEQQLLDCGFGKNGADGCDGSWPYAYVKTIADSNMKLAHESNYLYKAKQQRCPSYLKPHNQGAKVTGHYHTWNGDEETLKRLVYEHGAVATSVKSSDKNKKVITIQHYRGGIFKGCKPSKETSHAVVVVGYGTDADTGLDYWLIKNSWGKGWGEDGFFRMQRGVQMCGIGQSLVTVQCDSVYGPTDAPLTTKAPCFDRFTDCPDLAKRNCKRFGEMCQKSCGLCKGMTPHVTNTCPDQFSNCDEAAKTRCYQEKITKNCCLSCGLGEGMTPAESNTCYDVFGGCDNNRRFMCGRYGHDNCKKTCGNC